jgi:hypothetical protein
MINTWLNLLPEEAEGAAGGGEAKPGEGEGAEEEE